MSFKEFLMALDEKLLVDMLNNLTLNTSIPEIAHEQLWQLLKYYFIVGGLPEVVSIFCENKHNLFDAFSLARHKQEDLIKNYYSDIAKHSEQDVPNQLARSQNSGAQKFKFKGIISGIDRYIRLANVIDWLLNTGLLIKVHSVNTCQQPLKAYTKENQFKLFLFDVGLLGCMSDLAPELILKYDYGTYKGFFAENFVCQELTCQDSKPLYNWQEQTSEIEFLKEMSGDIIPIEVKSGMVTHAKSLNVFATKYTPPFNIILSAKKKMVSDKSHTYYLPLYLSAELSLLLEPGSST
jgi:predicted AAA+ superfamily ATPase